MIKKIFISLIALTISAYGMENYSGAGYNAIQKLLTTHKQNNQTQVDSNKKKQKNRDPFLATKNFIGFDLNEKNKNKINQDVLIDLNELPETKEFIIISDDKEVVENTDAGKVAQDRNNLKPNSGLNIDNQIIGPNAKDNAASQSEKKIYYRCRYCAYSSTNMEVLAMHIRGCHRGKPPYPCPFCDMERNTNRYFNEHIKWHIRRNDQPVYNAMTFDVTQTMEIDEQADSNSTQSSQDLPQKQVVLKFGNKRLNILLPVKHNSEKSGVETESEFDERESIAQILENLNGDNQSVLDNVNANQGSNILTNADQQETDDERLEETDSESEFLIRFATDEEIALLKAKAKSQQSTSAHSGTSSKKRKRNQITNSKRFQCDYCEKDYAQLCSLNRHIKDKH